MNERLERLRDELRQQISPLGLRAPTDETIDDCLYSGMNHLMQFFPATEKVVTLTVEGPTQNIATLLAEPMYSLIDIMYPWEDGYPRTRYWPYISIGWDLIMFTSVNPQIDDKMKIQYRSRYTLGGLRGATTDTLPANYEHAVLTAATAQYIRKLAMQPGADKRLGEMAVEYEDRADQEIFAIAPVAANPAWTHIGL